MPIVLKALFFTAAVICFVAATFRRTEFRNIGLVPLGLALCAAVFAVDAWAAVDD